MMSTATNAAAISTDPSWVASKLLEAARPALLSKEACGANQSARQAAFSQSSPESGVYDSTQRVVELPTPDAAQNGDADAQFDLGLCYDRGDGVERNSTKAFEWYRKAARQGLAKAQSNLAVLYLTGDGIVTNYGKAVKWFRRSAEQGVVDSQNYLGALYETGIGVKPNLESAIEWYRRAAEQGFPESQYMLGTKYGLGYGLQANRIESFRWVRYAANQGHTASQWLVASFYFGGIGVCKDHVEAYKWALLARSNRSKIRRECEHLLAMLQNLLNETQVRRCETVASRWKAKDWDQLKPVCRNPALIETPDSTRYKLSAPIQAAKVLLERWNIGTELTARFIGFGQSQERYVEEMLTGREILIQGSEAEDRIVYLYYIRCVLGAMFRDKEVENRWLRMPDPKLGGKSLMDLILSGPWTDLLAAMHHVDWVSGRSGC